MFCGEALPRVLHDGGVIFHGESGRSAFGYHHWNPPYLIVSGWSCPTAKPRFVFFMLTLLGISAVGSTFTARQFVYKSHADVRLVTLRGDHQCSVFDDDDHFREQELNIVALAISNESTKVVFASCCPNVVMFYFFIAEQSA